MCFSVREREGWKDRERKKEREREGAVVLKSFSMKKNVPDKQQRVFSSFESVLNSKKKKENGLSSVS